MAPADAHAGLALVRDVYLLLAGAIAAGLVIAALSALFR